MKTKQGSSGLEKFLAFVLILMIIGVGYLMVTTFLLPGQPASPAATPAAPPTEAASESDDGSEFALPPTFTPEASGGGDFDPASGEIPGLIPVGIHLVGGDGIKPGVYQGLGGEGLFDSCYWSRLKDLEETPESIIANDNGTGQYYVEVLESGKYVMGPMVGRFEKELAEYFGLKHAIGVNSGTDALWLAFLACGIGPGDEVITTTNTFFATA